MSGLYYKHVTIVNYASSGINRLKASLNDDARVIIYNRHMFIVQATGMYYKTFYSSNSMKSYFYPCLIFPSKVEADWGECYKTFHGRNLRIFVIT
jgi:hypothetical protein